MIKTCILVFIFSTVAIKTSEIQIPENFKLAKPISEHPRYQGHQLLDNFNLNIKTSSLIIGGQPAVRGQFPHHALIFIIHPNGDTYICGGSIIDLNWILTAGHCVYGEVQYFEIYLGVASLQGPASWGARIYPQDVILHSEYDDRTLNNDIALIKLVSAPENLFFDPFIAPIALPSRTYDLVEMNGTAIGFGRESDSSTSVSELLKFKALKTITTAKCASYYIPGLVHETNLCAETNSQASTCGGDSGFNTLEGVTSFGAQNGCQLGIPVGFSKVASYLDWIYFHTNINKETTKTPEDDNREILKKHLQDSLKIGRNGF